MKRNKCPYCPKSFQSPKDLDRHLRKKHGLSPVTLKETTSEEKAKFIEQCQEMLEEKNNEDGA